MYGMSSWAGLMGAVSLEMFGHLHNVVDTPGALFEAVVEQYADLLFSGTDDQRRTSKTT